MSYGPNPWQQASWDWRAAGNFIGGGMGSGLLIVAALLPNVLGSAPVWLGLSCVGIGLLCVWLEIGRPWRALHVFFNPQTSWMSREAFVALLLFPVGLLTLLGLSWAPFPLAVLALAYLYCQSRMLPATRGIPAWRARLLTPLMLATGLVEGCGLWLILSSLGSVTSRAALIAFVVLIAVRYALWKQYRGEVEAQLAPRARRALDGAGRALLLLGTLGAGVAALVSLLMAGGVLTSLFAVGAGVAALFAGAAFKYLLITRAAFNQGFTLVKIPVRGARTSP